MKKTLTRMLLSALNSRWLNNSPCRYGFIGNVDAFSIENLRSEEKQRPGITVKTILYEAEMFAACPLDKGELMVIEDGKYRGSTVWDLHQLRNEFSSSEEKGATVRQDNRFPSAGEHPEL